MDMVSKPARRQKPKARAHGEGSVYLEKKTGRWVATVSVGIVNGKRRRKALSFDTQAQARQALTKLTKALDDGIAPGDDRMTLGRYLEKWLAECVEGPMSKLRAATQTSYVGAVRNHLIPGLGHLPLARLSPLHLQAFLSAKLTEKNDDDEVRLSPRSVQYMHAILRASLRQAERWGLVTRNVAKLVDPPAVPKKEAACLTAEQAGKLLAKVEGHRLRALFTLAIAVGLRRGELLGLRWQHVDLDAGIIRVREQLQRVKKKTPTDAGLVALPLKTERSRRTLRLPRIVLEQLKEHSRAQKAERLKAGALWADTGYVFTTEMGEPLDGRNVHALWKALLDGAGLPSVPFHATRHTAASFMLAQGASIFDVKENHGHSQIALTANTYAHLLDELREATAARADAGLVAAHKAAKDAARS